MTKVSRKRLHPDKYAYLVNSMWSGFALMPTKADTRLLFNDLITRTEKEMLAKRLAIARMLLDNIGYDEIQKELNVTPGTISAVSDVLAERGEGFRVVHKKLSIIEQKQRSKEVERRKNLENPFRNKASRKTLLGAALKYGIKQIDKRITLKIKKHSATKTLPL